MRDLAENRYLSPELIEQASRRLDELGGLINRKDLAAACLSRSRFAASEPRHLANNQINQSRSSNEFMMRSRASKVAQSATPARRSRSRAERR